MLRLCGIPRGITVSSEIDGPFRLHKIIDPPQAINSARQSAISVDLGESRCAGNEPPSASLNTLICQPAIVHCFPVLRADVSIRRGDAVRALVGEPVPLKDLAALQ